MSAASGTRGRKSNPPTHQRISLAVRRYTSQRTPLSTYRGTPSTVCSTCMRRGVGVTRW